MEGQLKLLNASVLVIGAGGLGCPFLQYTAGAGIGKIGIVDFDVVDISNLHRQLLFTEQDKGFSKAKIAAERIQNLAPNSIVNGYDFELNHLNALELLNDYDLIVDASDQIHVRYLVNDACDILNKPWIYGAVNGYQGQWAIFNSRPGAANYRDAFPNPPNPLTAINCENTGILGPIPGAVAMMQALLCLDYFTGNTRENTLLFTTHYNDNSSYNIEIPVTQYKKTDRDTFIQSDYRSMIISAHY